MNLPTDSFLIYPETGLRNSYPITKNICEFFKYNPTMLARVLCGKEERVRLSQFLEDRLSNYSFSLAHMDTNERKEQHNETIKKIVELLKSGKRIEYAASCHRCLPPGPAHLQLKVYSLNGNIRGEQIGNIGIKVNLEKDSLKKELILVYTICLIAFLFLRYSD